MFRESSNIFIVSHFYRPECSQPVSGTRAGPWALGRLECPCSDLLAWPRGPGLNPRTWLRAGKGGGGVQTKITRRANFFSLNSVTKFKISRAANAHEYIHYVTTQSANRCMCLWRWRLPDPRRRGVETYTSLSPKNLTLTGLDIDLLAFTPRLRPEPRGSWPGFQEWDTLMARFVRLPPLVNVVWAIVMISWHDYVV